MPTYYSQTMLKPNMVDSDTTTSGSVNVRIYSAFKKLELEKQESSVDEEKEFYRKHVLSK